MKFKSLLIASLLTSTFVGVNAQTYGLWQGQSNATPFEYTVGAGTLGTTYAADGTAKSSISTSPTSGYLAFPASGTVRVFTSAGGGGGFVINSAVLNLTSSISSATLNKFALYGINNTSAVTSIFFKVKIASTPAANTSGGTTIIGFGKSGETTLPADDVFLNDKQLNVATSTTEPGIFGAFRFQSGASQTNTGVRYLRSSDGTYRYSDASIGNSYTTFPKNTDLNVEIYCNNTNISRNYTRGVTNYVIPPRTYNVFANNTLLTVPEQPVTAPAVATLISNIPSTELGLGKKIDAIFIGGHDAATNQQIVSISDVKFGWIPQNVLPIKLTSFNGDKVNSGVKLNWTTAQEKDNSHFEILRAGADRVFNPIAQVKGNGTTDVTSNYTYTDYQPLTGNNYYQLKQVDFNGESTTTDPIAVNFGLNESSLKLFLNQSDLNVSFQATENGDGQLTVADINGKKVINQKVKVNSGFNQYTVAAAQLPAGFYIATVNQNGKLQSAKFIK